MKLSILIGLLLITVANANKHSVILEAMYDCEQQISKIEKNFNKKVFKIEKTGRHCEFVMDFNDKELEKLFDNDRVLYTSVYN